MSVTNADIDSAKHDISKTSEALENLYISLGKHACPYHSEIAFSSSEIAYSKLCEAFSKQNEINEKIVAVKHAVYLLDNGGSEISKTQTDVRKISSDIDTLTSSLGAVAYEVMTSGALPDSLQSCMDSMREYDNKLEKLSQQAANANNRVAKVVAEKQMEVLKKHVSKSFYETGIALLESPCLGDLPSSRASSIISKIQLLKAQKTDAKAEIFKKTSDISKAENSLKNMGVLGEENRKLKELEQKNRKILNDLEDRFHNYGSVLADGMDKWLSPAVSLEIQEDCRKIGTEQCRLKKQRLYLDYLLAERDIEILDGQHERLQNQLEHLRVEKNLIETQITDISKKLCNNEHSVEVLRLKEKDITRNVSELNTGDLL